jgi:hypothetical protein
MEVSFQLHTQASLLPVAIGSEVRWAAEPIWILWSKKNIFAPARNGTPAVKPIDHHYSN